MRKLSLIFLAILATLSSPAARAVVLDWDTISWTAGSLNNSYDIDPGHAGNDVTVGIVANGGAAFQPEIPAPNPQTPAVNPSFQGGLATTENSLCIALNLTSNSQSVTVTISFSALYTQGVNNVSFQIFDVDFSNASGNTYQDQLSAIRALSIDGTTLIAPTITTSVSNALSGSGLSQVVTGTSSTVDTGAGSGNGNVMISFGTNAIKSLTFTYGSGTMFADPTYQHIGIYDINFTPIPEVNPAWSAILSCVAASILILRHRGRRRR